MPKVPYKNPYFYPKNMFKPRSREYYASQTTYKLPEHLKPILEEYLKKPQPKFNKKYYCVCCNREKRSKEQLDLANFIFSIAPDRRREDNRHTIYLVQRPKGFTKTFVLNPHTKDKILPLVFEAIEKGIL